MRLVKYLAHSGVASRRRSEELIAAGRVKVGGEVVTDPARDVDEDSGVQVDGKAVSPEAREVWMLNKPRGVVSTAREPGRRRAVVELVDSRARLYPVGRLDADSTGLILLTNDGGLAERLMHPRHEVPRTYRVRAAPRRLTRSSCGSFAAASSSRTGRPRRPRCERPPPRVRDHDARRAATARSGGWSRRSATRSSTSSGFASAR